MTKILVVDDEEEVRSLIKSGLEQNGYAAITASSGLEALDICKTNKPDLILLDIVMPEMDGYEACEKLKNNESTKDIPILFLTGKDMGADSIIGLYNMGASDYVPKPSSFKEILSKIKALLKE